MTRLLRGGMVARTGRFAVALLGVLAGTSALAWAVGSALPDETVVRAEAVVGLPPADVFRALTSTGTQPAWRHDVRKVEPDGAGWVEEDARGLRWHLSERVRQEPARWAVEIHDDAGAFFSERTVELEPVGAATRVRVALRTRHPARLERFAAFLMDGDAREAEAYLSAVTGLAPR